MIEHWLHKMGRRVGNGAAEMTARRSCSWVRRAAKLRRARAIWLRRRYEHWLKAQAVSRFSRLYEKWRCIHEHEGAWNANTGNGYWGGLQMTFSFQQAHGPQFLRRWGTADNWPVWAQLEAAEDAWHDDGGSFREWSTAGICGLA